jgi:hypothetical protein
MERVVQTAPCSIIVHLLASQSVGTTASGCAGLEEAGENCVGFLNQLALTTVIEPKWQILCY